MELRHIKDLMIAMKRHGTKKLRYQSGDLSVELEQQDTNPGVVQVVEPMGMPLAAPAKAREIPASSGTALGKEAEKPEPTGNFVTSPIVGTFYSSPSPDDPPFVQPGDKVTADTVVCIIEAMKVMNEVKAGIAGTVSEVLVENGHPVEFGANLFQVQ